MLHVDSTLEERGLAKAFRDAAVPFRCQCFDAFWREGDRYFDEDGLELRAEFEEYEDSAALEWTLWLENKGERNSRQIKDLLPLSCALPAGAECRLSYPLGTAGKITDFQFTEQVLNDSLRLSSVGSRSVTPFFNLDLGGHGVLIAIGWTKNWFLEIQRRDGEVYLSAGMPETDFYLMPGERVRTPRILLLFWQGDKARSYNLLRRHLLKYHIPKDSAGEPEPPVCLNVWGSMKTQHHLELLEYVKAHDLRFDVYWMDAGWYGPDHETVEYQRLDDDDWIFWQGDWRVNRAVHPNGLRPISDGAHALGMKFLLWYDLWNAVDGIGWTVEHPEWGHLEGPMMGNSRHEPVMISMLNANHPEARAWITKTLLDSIEENGVDGYREDPPPIYGGEDAPGRCGISEMKAVETLYAFWDALRERYPDILIDNCGGGGSRIDLETVSRAYVLWRTDYNCDPCADPIGPQTGNLGLGRFVPLIGGALQARPGDDYAFRSGLYGGFCFGLFPCCTFDGCGQVRPADDYPVEWHRQRLQEYQALKPCYSGDFHVLADCGTADDGWAAYEMSRPDLGEAAVLAFRRPNCGQETITVTPVLEPGVYVVTNRDTGAKQSFDPAKDREFVIFAPKPETAILLQIKKV